MSVNPKKNHRMRHFDTASIVTILLTFLLFAVALYLKGLVHDMLLEAGVLLVSIKLILMSYHQGMSAEATQRTLDEIKEILHRMRPKDQASGER